MANKINFSPIRTDSSHLNTDNIPLKDGQIIYVVDTKETYIDNAVIENDKEVITRVKETIGKQIKYGNYYNEIFLDYQDNTINYPSSCINNVMIGQNLKIYTEGNTSNVFIGRTNRIGENASYSGAAGQGISNNYFIGYDNALYGSGSQFNTILGRQHTIIKNINNTIIEGFNHCINSLSHYSHIEGYDHQIGSTFSEESSSINYTGGVQYSHIEGHSHMIKNTDPLMFSHIEGKSHNITNMSGSAGSHIEGNAHTITGANGSSIHVEGNQNKIIAGGAGGDHIEGTNNTYNGGGGNNHISGSYNNMMSVAGNNILAGESNTLYGGPQNTVFGGMNKVSSGAGSLIVGQQNMCGTFDDDGNPTSAPHACLLYGYYNTVLGDHCLVGGEYNSPQKDQLLSIGNGTLNNRSNIIEATRESFTINGRLRQYDSDSITLDWTANTEEVPISYKVGSIVIYNNCIYRCNTDNTDGEWTSEHWDQIGITLDAFNALETRVAALEST